MPATNATPRGAGTTSNEWWTTDWRYFVMPESAKEALQSDGTPYAVVSDVDIASGVLTNANGTPKYPIVISLASEAARDDEIAPLTNYVAAGGFLLVGSSAFTRNTNGTTRTNFAFATEMGVNMVTPALTNWRQNTNLAKQLDHRLVSHIPAGTNVWSLPSMAEEIPWGTSPSHAHLFPHQVWQVQASDATVLARGDLYPCLLVKQFGKGYFIYYATKQPLIGHGGWSPGMYTYLIFRNAIEWAFESANLPVAKLSPWPYSYDAAFMVRHDLENYTNQIANIAASAQFEYTNGAKGDYYFCTGTLREDASPVYNTNAIIAGLRQAITNYGATIGPHNGGLRNPNNTNLVRGDYDYWHWGPDEALDVTPTNYPSGKAYALTSLSDSFQDVESWLTGIANGPRAWVSCYFNATREDSYDIQDQLGVKIAGEQKLSPFPHWTLSTRTPGKRYAILSEPVSDWYVNGSIAQNLEPWHPPAIHTSLTMRQLVDFYYGLGALINLYSHNLSHGDLSTAAPLSGNSYLLVPDYITYSLNTNLHPRLWSANAVSIYQWWLQRSNAQITVSYSTNGNQSITTFSIKGATDTNTTVEILVPATGSALGLQVFTNSVLAAGNDYRTTGQVIKVKVGTSITNAQVRYILGPNTQNDLCSAQACTTLTVGAPGVLGNDSAGLGTNLTAALLSGPENGSLVLNPNGGFSYTPASDFIGTDSFTYAATNEQTNSSPATVVISVAPAGAVFADNFSREKDPGTLSPWLPQSGAWRVAGGSLQGGPNIQEIYAHAYLTNSWTNYSVQARVQFSTTNAWGGGIGGRLNPATGAHYAAWIYPDGSPGGTNILRLIKFQSWTSFAYNGSNAVPMQEVNLGAVGTNWHTVKLVFSGPQIAVYYDANQVMSVMDVEAQPHASGGIIVSTWTYSTAYTMSVDDLVVRPLVAADNYNVSQNATLTIAPPGVLGNDSAVYSPILTAVLATGPTNGTLNLNSDGAFTYTPNTNYLGTDTFIYQANDGPTNLGDALVTMTVVPNHAPVLTLPANQTIPELVPWTDGASATDTDLPPNAVTFELISGPSGLAVDAAGLISWTPTEVQGPSTNIVTVRAFDNGVPGLSTTNSFTVTVNEVNITPILTLPANQTISELVPWNANATAIDTDLPPNTMSFEVVSGPSGLAVGATGLISWTPAEVQGPSTNIVTVRVFDNGVPSLNATNSFTLTVNEVNSAPVLQVQTNWTIVGQDTLLVTNTATDADLPQQALTYQLVSPPSGASINTNGVITWTPATNQVPSTNVFTTKVTDDGLPSLSVTNSYTVFVSRPAVVILAATALVAEGCLPTNNAIDPGETVTVLFDLKATGTNNTVNLVATLLATNGTVAPSGPQPYGVLVAGGAAVSRPFTFTANGTCGSNITATLQLQDGASNLGTIAVPFTLGQITPVFTESFDSVTAPALPSDWTTSAAGAASSWTTTNSSADSPPNAVFSANANNVGLNEIVSPSFTLPGGAVQLTFQNRYYLESDNLNPTNGYDAGVLEIKIGTNAFTDITNAGGIFLSGGYNARVSTLYSNSLSGRWGWSGDSGGYISTVVNLPTAVSGQTIRLRWRCGTDDGGPSGSGWWIDNFSIKGRVCCANTAPALPLQPNQTINELTTLTVTNTATDAESPPEALSYSLLAGPTNAAISTNGVISWNPTEAQGPGVYTFTTEVSDSASPSLSDTNSFTLTVNEVNSAPVLSLPTDQTIEELALWSAEATAIDTDQPTNTLTFELLAGPSGLTVSSNGLVSWTPSEAQGPSTNIVTVRVFDDGVPSLADTNSFTLTVNEVNGAPGLSLPTDQTIEELALWSAEAIAIDTDQPTNTLTFELLAGPSGLTVSSNGLVSWTPSEAQGPSTNTVTVRVFDDGVPSLADTNSFTLTVNEVNDPPVMPVQTNHTIIGLTTLIVTNTASDPDIPANSLVYTLLEGPTNALIDTNGIITWTPVPEQMPSTNVFTTEATDYNPWAVNAQLLSATNSFTVVVVAAIHNGPALPSQPDRTVNEDTVLVVTNTAVDTDVPPLGLTYQLLNPPSGALVDSAGVITFTPTEFHGPGVYVIKMVVTDDGVPALSATNSFTATVNEVNTPPDLPGWPDGVLSGGETLSFLNAASDLDKPANSLTYQLIEAPVGAVIDANGFITWTPAAWQIPSTNTFTTVATDYSPWAVNSQQLSATNSFTVRVYEPGVPPVIVSVTVTNGVAAITWSAMAGKIYRLQFSDSPPATNWNDLLPDITSTGSRVTALNSLSNAPVRLYRVFQLP